MKQTMNSFGHHVLTADEGKFLTDGVIFTKTYISVDPIDSSLWSEVDAAEVPQEDEISDTEALAIITGGSV